MDILKSFNFKQIIFNNTIIDYLLAILAFLAFLAIFYIIKNKVWQRLEKVGNKNFSVFKGKLSKIIKSINFKFILVLSLWLAAKTLILNNLIVDILNTLLIVVVFYQGVIIVNVLIKFWIDAQKDTDRQKKNLFNFLSTITTVIIWIFAILLILANLGVNVTSLIAGLGIGGIAVALAAQNILGDLFASLTIYFDKPFEVGDFIYIDKETMGTVDQIGFRSTRMVSIQGEQIIINNSLLTSKKIYNYKKMAKRRVAINFGVVYQTSQEKMKEIPEIVKKIVGGIERMDLDRVHFKEFADSALVFEVVYYINSADYNEYMDLNQRLHMEIKGIFEEKGIEMAFPTQTVYFNNLDK
jgi:small-conductance mechanosensitive channel